MLYVEQPTFVGFSYSNNISDKNTGDIKSAMDNYKFLQLFIMTQFPEFAGRDLWFTGESYGGVYVPMLADYVLADNSTVLYKAFKGFMIGNPVFNCQGGMIGEASAYDIDDVNALYWHGLVSYTNYNNWTMQGCNDPTKAAGYPCQWIYDNIFNQIGYIDQEKRQIPSVWPSVDPDDLFQDFCTGNGTLDFINSPLMDDPNSPCDEEIGDLIVEYLNRPDVQFALDVPSMPWDVCSPLNYKFEAQNMVNYYLRIIRNKPGVNILVYSGDLDILTVPLGYTLPCLSQISKNIMSNWQPWFVNGVTAGYVEKYDMFTYATLKGAGHEAPLYQPVSSYQLIYRFLMNGNLDENVMRRVRTSSGFRKQSDMLRYYGLQSK
jgi:serine carboxypeptidase-like clade 2